MGVLEVVVPGLKQSRVRAEKTNRFLDFAYSTFGGETGNEVTLEQVSAVLKAELGVLQSSKRPNFQPPFTDEQHIKEALKLHTKQGLYIASLFMYVKADMWREAYYSQNITESDSKTDHEVQRRAIACESAKRLLESMAFEI